MLAGESELTVQEKGGLARAESLSPAKRSQIASKAAKALWGLPKVLKSGVLPIGGGEIECFVLETGERVLSTRGVMKAMGRRWRGRKYTGTDLPVFLEARNLAPFIGDDLAAVSNPIRFRVGGRLTAEGFRAEILPIVCEVYLKARDIEGTLSPKQETIAAKCEILMRALSRTGVIALVDEATGFQDQRPKDALAQYIQLYIAKELRQWVKTFPTSFFAGLCRLKGIALPDDMKLPRYFGHLVNDLVWDRLAPAIRRELDLRNPVQSSGRRRHRHHQWLTDGIGHPKLLHHLGILEGMMGAFGDGEYDQFHDRVERTLVSYKKLSLWHQPPEEPEAVIREPVAAIGPGQPS